MPCQRSADEVEPAGRAARATRSPVVSGTRTERDRGEPAEAAAGSARAAATAMTARSGFTAGVPRVTDTATLHKGFDLTLIESLPSWDGRICGDFCSRPSSWHLALAGAWLPHRPRPPPRARRHARRRHQPRQPALPRRTRSAGRATTATTRSSSSSTRRAGSARSMRAIVKTLPRRRRVPVSSTSAPAGRAPTRPEP